ncbi:cysteine-rich RLK RECEPTOR-like protein kinase [Gossypium australe]|uniref:Cysteine-rich RLK RECEPTOR-like protein kinase n=1 Tax=Gossypium australe TaxID=47621 RepID=A0A5B6VBG4_9ROSI|nr:cysteine-rich RLK RECEPTOR-like protein kinase [Gossypium australe]
MTTVRTILALAASQDWSINQIDVKNLFLHGDLTENIYMRSPPGLTTAANEVCHLKRSLYELKQASRAWFAKFKKTLLDLSFIQRYDADWVGCLDTCHSTKGWCVYLGDTLISWKCKKQNKVSKSSTETEYRTMSATCSEITCLRGLFSKMGYQQIDPTPLHVDSTSAIQIVAKPIFHERTKHIEVDFHSIQKSFDNSCITLPHVSTDQ